MKFIYGKQDLKNMERGQENCYLLTNGLGGFSSATMIGSASRNDHAILMACLKAPNHRYNLIHRLSEKLAAGQETRWISSQEFAGNIAEAVGARSSAEDGFTHLATFSFEDIPTWVYDIDGIELTKEIAMKHGENTTVMRYTAVNHTRRDWTLTVTPFMQFTPKGQNLEKSQEFTINNSRNNFRNNATICSAGICLYIGTDGDIHKIPPVYETDYYAYDHCDGRRSEGLALANHRIHKEVKAGETTVLNVIYSTEAPTAQCPSVGKSVTQIIEDARNRREALADESGFKTPVAQMLAKSADQFIAARESTGGGTILAGYPFFEDWGRDTMIALPGLCISTGRFETAKSILRTFMRYQHKGLLPNLFPEGENDPAYNTVDAALLFINTVYLYEKKTGDIEFVKESYPAMKETIRWYMEGTDYDIHMEEDGLIAAGAGFDQVTWMDVRVGEILPTPRHGKPVEINAYWYNALRIMEEFAQSLNEPEDAKAYGELAAQVKESFTRQFWMEEKHCLKDVLSGTKADTQIRCNQVWAISLPYTMLPPDKEREAVETVWEKLYTPYGLRTLSPDDPEFQPTYGGSQLKRDMAYHQGTVWVYPLGAYYLAYLKVYDYDCDSLHTVRCRLETMESAMREGCIGQLPEIYDGANPTSSKGCFAQAWSVGELLRVYELLEQYGNKGE